MSANVDSVKTFIGPEMAGPGLAFLAVMLVFGIACLMSGYAGSLDTLVVWRFLTGLGLGVIEGLTKVFYPEASSTVVFVIMVIVLLIRPAGLFGKEK